MLKDAALKYTQSGFTIIPLKPRKKEPPIKWKRYQKRKPTRQEVNDWWAKWPDANIALLTGKINNFIAFDEDSPEAEKFIKKKGGFPPGPQSITKKGRHYLFKHPGFLVHQDVNKKLTLDVRGDGGYIVAPPSIHPDGAQYSWAPGLSIFEIDPPEMRPWQIEYLKEYCGDEGDGSRNIEGWHEEVIQGVEKGSRNDTAARLAGRYIEKGLSDEEVISILLSWNKKNRPPLPQNEIIQGVKSIREKDTKRDKKKSRPDKEISPFDGKALLISIDDIKTRDFFENKRFVPQYLAKYLQIKFEPIAYGQGDFYQYNNNGVWKTIESDLLGHESEKILDKHTKSARIEDSIKTLQKRVYIRPGKFLHDPNYLNLRNGMLEIATVELKEHNREYYNRVQLNVSLNKKARCPRWDKFLDEIFPDAPAKKKALQSYFGYCLLPDCRHQRCLFLLGAGANGKSVVTDVLISILGEENVCSLPLQLMGERFLIGQLKDKLVNVASEIATNRPTDTSCFKDAVTGGLLMADQKHGKPFAFYPIAKHIFSMNETPKITDKSYGFQRRPIVIKFMERFEGEKRDPYLTKKLIQEKEGIFMWMLEGLLMVLEKDDLIIPDVVEKETKEMIKATNPVLLFVDDCCVLDDDYRVKPKDLFKEYSEWCKEGHNRPLSRNRFYDQILLNFSSVKKKQVKDNRMRMYIGIGIRIDQD